MSLAGAVHPGNVAWLARHEMRLAWRDWATMMTGGGRRRGVTIALGAVAVAAVMQIIAYKMIGPDVPSGADPDRSLLILVTGCALLTWSLTLSQAMEMVTRAFYARQGLDLLLASPVSARKIFAVRVAAITLSTGVLAVPLASPFIFALVYSGGPRWFGAYGVAVAMALAASAIAVTITIGLFRLLGARRTRLVAQIIASIVGAAFVIGVQALAIVSTNTLSRFAALQSDALKTVAPDAASLLFVPARAIMGDLSAIAGLVAASAALLVAATALFSGRFARLATEAAGIAASAPRRQAPARSFRPSSPAQALRRKEWMLLKRDPWLVSQTLMQILYLLPPALLLWRNFGQDRQGLIVLVPVFVMAAGQLAGGLAWLAVSGEDAPDLIASAPVTMARVLRAKVEAVLAGVALALAPFVLALALASPFSALVAAGGILLASGSATLIQLWFRHQAKRSHFRRRQTSSRIATFAEAFSSITWAATAALAATGTWMAVASGVAGLLILAGVYSLRPR